MVAVSKNQLDCVVNVITPENIEFEYLLAGPFQRLPAFLVDLMFRWGIFLAALFLMLLANVWAQVTGSGWLFTFGMFLLYFLISWFYGILLETILNGRTIGKIIFGLRVISTDGRPINASQAALRNLLRSADMAPLLSLQIFDAEAPAAYVIPTMFLGLVSMTLTARLQRIGDLAASTMVILDRSGQAPTVYQPEDQRAYALAELIPPTFQVTRSLSKVVGLYMETRRRFSAPRRFELASTLARPLLPQLGLAAETSPDLLLCALYVRTFLSEEHRNQSLTASRDRLARSAMPPVSARSQTFPESANPTTGPTRPPTAIAPTQTKQGG